MSRHGAGPALEAHAVVIVRQFDSLIIFVCVSITPLISIMHHRLGAWALMIML